MPFITEIKCEHLKSDLLLTKDGLSLDRCDVSIPDKPSLALETTTLILKRPVRLCQVKPGEYQNPPCDMCKLVTRQVYEEPITF